MSNRTEGRLRALLLDHDLAVQTFVGRANAIDATRWLAPRAEGKWTPAQETQHVLLAYEAFTRQLTDDVTMRRRTNAVRTLIARMIGLTSILWFKRIPMAVKAPREVRPEWIDAPAAELVPQLRQQVERFVSAFGHSWRSNPRQRMTHYLFGRLSLDQGIRLVTVHTRHHAAFLPTSSSPAQ
jgi:hypothetical protein